MSIYERSPQERSLSPESLTVPTYLSTVTDPEKCEDSDDSFVSISSDSSLTLIVLITHPAQFLDKADPLFHQALANKYSYYDPYTGMLPQKFTRRFSLSRRQPTPVLAYSLSTNSDYPEEIQFSLHQAYSRPLAFLTYSQADAILNNSDSRNPIYEQLHLAQQFFHRTRSLTEVQPKKAKISINQPTNLDQISFTDVIAHLMKVTNLLSVQYAYKHNIPLLIRNCTQTNPGAICQHTCPHHTCHQNYDSTDLKGFYCPVSMGHTPLGAKRYTHGTSPLRRVVDMVNQMQFHAHLTHQPYPFSYSELQLIAKQIQT